MPRNKGNRLAEFVWQLALWFAALAGSVAPFASATARPAAKAAPTDAVAQARDAFARGDLAALLALENKTQGDPLAATVTAWRLTLQILRDDPALNAQRVERFLATHSGTDPAERVLRALAQKAVERNAWPEARRWLEGVQRHDATTRCWLAHARLETAAKPTPNHANEALALLAETPLPNDACTDYFRAASARDLLTAAQFTEKLLAATFERGAKPTEAWRALLPPSADTPVLAQALTLVARARENPAEVWQQAAQLPAPFAATVARAAFLAAARRGDALAASWAANITPSAVWHEPLEWQIRVTLQREDWLAAWRLLEQLPASSRNEPVWRFWRAWALKALGKPDAARAILTELAQNDDFYGLLAGELLSQPLALAHEPLPSAEAQRRIAHEPQVAAIRALAARGWDVEAQREVDLLAKRWQSPQAASLRRAAAALLAADGRFDLAIRLLEKSREPTAWSLRYPTPWRTEVIATANREGVDPAWAYGVMRQESRFRPDARSPSGALGLMQVMPSTGKWVAQKRNERRFHPRQLLEPETNLRFGITYLRIMTEQLDGHPVLATGAYNAGPGRIGRLRQRLDLSFDAALFDALCYIELLPIAETRDYIRKVLANTVIYSHRLGTPKRLSSLLLPYGNAQPQLAAIGERLR